MMFTELANPLGFEKPTDYSLDSALSIIRWADSHHQRVRYSHRDYTSKYGRRSAAQTLDDGKVNFYVPCLDLVAVIGHLLQENGFPSEVILYESHNLIEHRSIHSRLQFTVDGKIYRLSTYRLGTAYYPNGPSIDPKHKPIKTMPFSGMDYNKPILEYAVEGGIENMGELIPGFNYHWLMFVLSLKNSQKKIKQVRDGFNKTPFDKEGIKICVNSNVEFLD